MFKNAQKKGFVKRFRDKLHEDNGHMSATMSKEQALNKVRKLLAMADKNSGATENEMMTAMAMARVLMLRHHISPNFVQGFRRIRAS